MSFTVLRVEVQQWKDESISLPVGGQSEEGVEADDVVNEAGHQEDCAHRGMRDTVLFVFMFRAECHWILFTLVIDPLKSITIIIIGIIFTAWWWCVEFDRQVDIGVHVCGREENIEYHDGQDWGHLHPFHWLKLSLYS